MMTALNTSIKYYAAALSQCVKQKQKQKEIKGTRFGKENPKPSLFTGKGIVYIENPEEFKINPTRLKLISKFSKVKVYKFIQNKQTHTHNIPATNNWKIIIL